MVENWEKIEKVSVQISKELHKEIQYAHKNLQDEEAKKRQGKKKKTWTQLEASHKLGKYLYSLRKKK